MSHGSRWPASETLHKNRKCSLRAKWVRSTSDSGHRNCPPAPPSAHCRKHSRRDPHDDPPRRPRRRELPKPVATLGDLQAECRWLWVNRAAEMHCSHRAPIALAPLRPCALAPLRPCALAPLVTRWGPDASSEVYRCESGSNRLGHHPGTARSGAPGRKSRSCNGNGIGDRRPCNNVYCGMRILYECRIVNQ